MKIENNPEMVYIEAGCYSYTFDDKKVKSIVESECSNDVLNLFAGKNHLNVSEIRVDISNEFLPKFNMSAEDFLKKSLKIGWKFKTIIYDPPWNERKSKEFYNGKYIGKFTQLKDDIVKILAEKGRIISIGYEISNFGKKRQMELKKVYAINPFGEIRPYFISIEQKKYINQINNYIG